MENETSITNTNSSDNNSASITLLDIFQCGFIDFPESRVDCSSRNPSVCLKCEIRGGYITGESINDKQGTGHLICRTLWIICCLVGIIGVLANALIILNLQRRRTNRSFDFLLTVLAYVDFSCCLSSLSACTAPIAYFDNWNGRGQPTLFWIYISALVLLQCRSISVYLTALVTIERYLVIAYPIRSLTWFSRSRSKRHVLIIIAFDIIQCIPRYTSLYIGENIYNEKDGGLDVPSLRELEYIFKPTKFYTIWIGILGRLHDYWLHVFDFWIPIPILVFFNIWTYRKVQTLPQERLNLNTNQMKEIRVARMFVPVVIVLLFCNFSTVIALFLIYFRGIYFREMWMIMVLTFQVNSTANFFIYYYRGTIFRSEAKLMFSEWMCDLKRKKDSLLTSLNSTHDSV